MPLVKDDLKNRFIKIFNDVETGVLKIDVLPAPMPLMPPPLAAAFAQAYHEWAMTAMANVMHPSPGVPDVIAAQLVLVPLMAGWGPGTIAYWSMVSWNLEGIATGVTIAANMAAVSAQLLAEIFTPPFPNNSSPKTKEEFADKLATILDMHTRMIQVTQTDLSTGNTAVVSPY